MSDISQPIALDGRKVPVDRAMELVSRVDHNGQGGSASFVAGTTMNQVTRSRYGQRRTQNLTKEIKKARNFVQAPSKLRSSQGFAFLNLIINSRYRGQEKNRRENTTDQNNSRSH